MAAWTCLLAMAAPKPATCWLKALVARPVLPDASIISTTAASTAGRALAFTAAVKSHGSKINGRHGTCFLPMALIL
jgi:hypothetical protein